MADWSKQLYWEDVKEGDEVPPVSFNLTVARLIVQAGGNRDFAPIHHDTVVAQSQGAPEMYANNVFCQSMWERTVREYIGLGGRIRKVGPFRMRVFNTIGAPAVTSGVVKRKWADGGDHLVELEMQTEHTERVSVGPGPVVVSLPPRP